MKSSACIEMLFTEYPFIDRIAKAAEAGFDAIEFWGWEDKDLPAIKAAADKAGVKVASFVGGITKTLIAPQHRDAYIDGVRRSIEAAKQVGAASLIVCTDEQAPDHSALYKFPELSYEQKYQSVIDGLKAMAPMVEAAGITLVLEPLNTIVDHPGFFLTYSKPGFDMLKAVNSPNIKMLFDIYHQQIMEGNIIQNVTENIDLIGHFHVADVPGRHEPGTGELNYANIFKAINKAGYQRFVGFEYMPTVATAPANSVAIFKGAKAAV